MQTPTQMKTFMEVKKIKVKTFKPFLDPKLNHLYPESKMMISKDMKGLMKDKKKTMIWDLTKKEEIKMLMEKIIKVKVGMILICLHQLQI